MTGFRFLNILKSYITRWNYEKIPLSQKHQIPIFARELQMLLIFSTSSGYDVSKPLTDSVKPASESLSNSGFLFWRVASCVEHSMKPVMLSACSESVLDNFVISVSSADSRIFYINDYLIYQSSPLVYLRGRFGTTESFRSNYF